MLVQPIQEAPQSAHIVMLGNEKGGSGKSTTGLHIAVALLKAGQRIATIDLDSRQQSFTHYIENRRAWAARASRSNCRRIIARRAAKPRRWKLTRRVNSPTSRKRSARSSTATMWW